MRILTSPPPRAGRITLVTCDEYRRRIAVLRLLVAAFRGAARAQRPWRLERQHLGANTNGHGVPRRRCCHQGSSTCHRRRRQLRPRSRQTGRPTSLESDRAAKSAAPGPKSAPGDSQTLPGASFRAPPSITANRRGAEIRPQISPASPEADFHDPEPRLAITGHYREATVHDLKANRHQ